MPKMLPNRRAIETVKGFILTDLLKLNVQTIAMDDAAVTLIVAGDNSSGTLLTGNILYVDAESGSSENLDLPAEDDCEGLFLMVVNTGGETINIRNDAASAVLTLETANTAIVVCDGTTWRGIVGVP